MKAPRLRRLKGALLLSACLHVLLVVMLLSRSEPSVRSPAVRTEEAIQATLVDQWPASPEQQAPPVPEPEPKAPSVESAAADPSNIGVTEPSSPNSLASDAVVFEGSMAKSSIPIESGPVDLPEVMVEPRSEEPPPRGTETESIPSAKEVLQPESGARNQAVEVSHLALEQEEKARRTLEAKAQAEAETRKASEAKEKAAAEARAARAAEQEANARKAAAESKAKAEAEAQKALKAKEKAAAEARAARAAEQEANARKAAAESKAKAEAEARKALEAKEKAAAEARQKAAMEAQKRQAEERARAEELARKAALAEALAKEEAQRNAQLKAAAEKSAQAWVSRYFRSRVEQAWLKPATASPGMSCKIQVRLQPDGRVSSVSASCSGDQAFERSAEAAVRKAAPFPMPPDPLVAEQLLGQPVAFRFNPE